MAQKQLGIITAYGEWLAAGNTGTKTDFLNSLKGSKGENGVGVPVGGSVGQVLRKKSTADYDTEWEDGGDSKAKAILVDDSIQVTSPVGGFKVGDSIKSTDSVWDFIKKLVNPVVPPTYVYPSLSIIGSVPLAREIGSSVSVTITPTWVQNDAGVLTGFRLYQGGSQIYSGSVVARSTSFLLSADTTFNAQADYNVGVVKNDSSGTPYPTGQIPAGTVISNNVVYIAQRNAFYGSGISDDILLSSQDVRSLPGYFLNPVSGTKLTAVMSIGDKGVFFAYPATLPDPISIMQNSITINVLSGFETSIISVEGANGFSSIPYKVFYKVATTPFVSSDSFTLTIG